MSAHTAIPWTAVDRGIGWEVHANCDGQCYTKGVYSTGCWGIHDGLRGVIDKAEDAAFIVTACNAHDRLEADNAALRKLLRELEWLYPNARCQICGNRDPQVWTGTQWAAGNKSELGHAADCRLDAALEEKE